MKISILMNIINISGNTLLIYGLKTGVEGVAIPTLVSRVFAAVAATVLLLNQSLEIHIERSLKYTPDGSIIKKILYIGVPNGMENSMFQLGKILVLSLISTFGTYAIAANAVSNVVANFQNLTGLSITLAMITVISRCVGAGEYEQVKYYVKKLMTYGHIGTFFTVALTFVLMPFIMSVYNLSNEAATAAAHILWLHGATAVVIWPAAFILPCVFRAAGDVKFSLIVSVTSMWICRVVFSYIIGRYMGLGVFGVWVAMIMDWCVRAVCFIARYKSGGWKNKSIVQ